MGACFLSALKRGRSSCAPSTAALCRRRAAYVASFQVCLQPVSCRIQAHPSHQAKDVPLQGLCRLRLCATSSRGPAGSDRLLAVTMAGFVFGAESALIAFERSQRVHENNMRRQAQAALTSRNIHPTEAAIQAWNNDRLAKLAAERSEDKS